VDAMELNAELKLRDCPVQLDFITLEAARRHHFSQLSSDPVYAASVHALASESVVANEQDANALRVDFLSALGLAYPQMGGEDRQHLFRFVCRKPVSQDEILKIKNVFDFLDTECAGLVPLNIIIPLLAKSAKLAEYIDVQPLCRRELSGGTPFIELRTLLRRLFDETHHHQMRDILQWGRPSAPLTAQQLQELHDLFTFYDADGSGSISLPELEEVCSCDWWRYSETNTPSAS